MKIVYLVAFIAAVHCLPKSQEMDLDISSINHVFGKYEEWGGAQGQNDIGISQILQEGGVENIDEATIHENSTQVTCVTRTEDCGYTCVP